MDVVELGRRDIMDVLEFERSDIMDVVDPKILRS